MNKSPLSDLSKASERFFGRKTRYAICGLSNRCIYNFLLPLLGKTFDEGSPDYSLSSEITGVLDIDRERVQKCEKLYDITLPFFPTGEGIDSMIGKARPDVLLITGPDYTHCDHIIAGLRHGLRVIAEKPVVINCEQMQRVLKEEQASSGSLVVTHNLRSTASHRKMKELLTAGRIGRITNIEFVYNLDTHHGSSYFYRWNRERSHSGGLTVHKSVHHFDLVNWLVDSAPEKVFAFGTLNYYGVNGSHRPKAADGSALTTAETRERCPYFQKHYGQRGVSSIGILKPAENLPTLPYAVQYPKDNYIYDPEIDIEDTYSAVVRYENGASMTYSINFSTPCEGYTLAINGTDGRLEISTLTGESGDPIVRLSPLFSESEEYRPVAEKGGHGGSDPMLRRHLFGGHWEESSRLGLLADSRSAALAVATGEAIWRSVKEGRPFTIRELLGYDDTGMSTAKLSRQKTA